MLGQTLDLLRRHGIRLSMRAGQPHVVDSGLLNRMVDYADVSEEDHVLEIGAGMGNLTQILADRAGNVTAVERDGRLIRILREQLKSHTNVEILHGDFLRLQLRGFDKVVANLPYGISSDVTFKLLERDFKLAVLMYQREFARRLVAMPGSDDYGRLTVNVYYRACVELLEDVPPEAFVPRPKVASTVVRLRARAPPFEVVDEGAFFDVVRALFQHRRQRVRNALYRSFSEVFEDVGSKVERRSIIDGILPRELRESRVMDLPPEKFGEIANLLAASLRNPQAWAAQA